MTIDNELIPCPVCGAVMNHHADKLIYESEVGDGSCEVLEQFYRCPNCGAGATRTATL